MLAWWAVEINKGALARPDRSRPEIVLHLAAELVTAGLLVAGGCGRWVNLAGFVTPTPCRRGAPWLPTRSVACGCWLPCSSWRLAFC